MTGRVILVLSVLLLSQLTNAKQDKSVIGPSNVQLAEGADQLLAGNAEDGVRLSLLGLTYAVSSRDRKAALSNICAGYVMLEQAELALEYCDRAIELDPLHWRAISNRALAYLKLERYSEAEQDVQRGLEIAPNARTLRKVQIMLLDATHPVQPTVVIDDRRDAPAAEVRQPEDDKSGDQAP